MDHIICELCQRQHETQDMDDAIAQDWRIGRDGWECPKCNADSPQQTSDARPGASNAERRGYERR